MNNNKLLATLILSTLSAVSFGVEEVEAADGRAGEPNTSFGNTTVSGYGENNSVEVGGAMIYDSGINSINGTIFESNHATQNGGAVAVTGGTLNITGAASFSGNSASSHGQDIYNAGTLNISGTLGLGGASDGLYNIGTATNTGAITGSITNAVTGSFTNDTGSSISGTATNSGTGAFINKGTIGTLNNSGTNFTNESAGNITTVTNSGTLTNKGTIGSLNNSGTNFENSGNGRITGAVTNTGTITSAADKFGGAITNTSGTVNLSGGALSVAITDGTLKLNGAVTVDDASRINGVNTLNLNGNNLTVLSGAISKAASSASDTFVIGNGTDSASVSLSSAITNAILVNTNAVLESTAANIANASSITNNGKVRISSGALGRAVGGNQLAFATGTSNTAAQNVHTLDVEGTFTNTGSVTVDTALNNAGTITNNGAGVLTLSGGSAVSPMVNAGTITGTGEFRVSGVTENTGNITQNILTVQGSKKLINTSNVTVNSSLNNAGEIENTGNLNINAATSNAGTISGEGTLNVANVLFTNNGTLGQNTINITGTNGGIDTEVSKLDNVGTISNNGAKTVLKGGSASSRVSTVSHFNSITGTGTTELQGYLTNNASITQGVLKIADGADVINNAIITAAITNIGKLETAADSLGGAVTNTGTVNLTGGALANSITGGIVNVTSGTVTLADATKLMSAGSIANAGTIQLDKNNDAISKAIAKYSGTTGSIVVNATGVTLSDVDIDNTITINSNKSLSVSNASRIKQAVTNKGTVTIVDGTLSQTVANTDGTVVLSGGAVSGNITNGTLSVTGNASHSASNSSVGTLSVSGGKTLTNTGKIGVSTSLSNSGTIANAGTLNFTSNGTTYTNTGAITKGTGDTSVINISNGAKLNLTGTGSITQNTINLSGANSELNNTGSGVITANISNKGKVKSSAVAGTVNNDGASTTYTVTSGTISNAVTGTGTTIIDGTVIANADVNKITVNEGAGRKLTIGASNVKGVIENNGIVDLNGGTLANAINGGTLNIKGAIETSAGNLNANTIDNSINDNTITLTSGTLAKEITGANGKVIINGTDIQSSVSIANKITINEGKKLTISADNVDGAVTNNNGTLVLNEGTLGQVVTGGALNLAGNVSTNANNLKSASVSNTTNNNELTLSGGNLTTEITGTNGVTKINGTVSSDAKINNKITVTGGNQLTIGAANVGGDVTNSGTVVLGAGSLTKKITNGTLNINGAVSTSAENLKADTINNSNTDNKLTLTGGTLTKAVSGTNGITEIAGTVRSENTISNKISVKDSNILTVSSGANLGNVVTNNNGTINIEGGTISNAINGADGITNLKGNITAISASIQNAVNIDNGVTVATSDAGNFGNIVDNKGTLELSGGAIGKAITSSNNSGVLNIKGTSATVTVNADVTEHTLSVANTDTLSISGGKSVTVQNTLTNNGTISGDGKFVADGTLTNNGTISSEIKVNETKSLQSALSGLSGNKAITNEGTLTITGNGTNGRAISGDLGTTKFSGTVTNNALITQNKLENSGTLSSTAANINAAVYNRGTYKITGAGTISKAINNLDSVVGTTQISGTGVVLDDVSVANNVEILGGGALSTAYAGNFDNTISNAGTLTLSGGTLDQAVSGGGSTVIDGADVKSDVSIENAITVNAGKKLTISADNVDGGAAINKAGSDIGVIDLKAGTLGSAITGAGTLNILGNVTTAAGNLGADTISVDTEKTLTLTGGALAKALTGLGSTVIDGNVEASNSIATLGGITVNAGDKLTIGASNVGANVTLNKEGVSVASLDLNAGTLSKQVSGDGTLNILGAVSTSADYLKANTITNNSAYNLTLTGGQLTKAITGTGKTEVAGTVTTGDGAGFNELLISSGSLTTSADYLHGAVEDNAELTVDGGTLSQNITGTGNVVLNNLSITDLSKVGNTGTANIGADGINLEGALTRNLGTGVVKLSNEITVAADRQIAGTLDLNDKSVNMSNDGVAQYSTLTVGTLKNAGNLQIDLDTTKAGSPYSDKISVGAVDGSAALNITSINVAADRDENYDGTNYFDFLDGAAKNNVTVTLNGGEPLKTYTEDFIYTFTKGDGAGQINVDSVKKENTLQDFLATGGGNTFSISKDTVTKIGADGVALDANIGATHGDGKVYTVKGNGNKITSSDTNIDGFVVSATDTFSLDGAKSGVDNSVMAGYKTAVKNSGNLSVSNMTISGSTTAIDNDATVTSLSGLALTGNTTAIDNSSTVTSADTLTLSNNTTAIQNTSEMTASNLTFTGNETDIANSGTLNLSGTNSITSDIKGVSGTLGTLNIDGGKTTVGSDADVTQTKLNVKSGELEANATNIKTEIANKATVTVTGGNITKNILHYEADTNGILNITENTNIGSAEDEVEVQIEQGVINVGAIDNIDVELTNYGHVAAAVTNWGTIHNNSLNTIEIIADATNNGTITQDDDPAIATQGYGHLQVNTGATYTNKGTIIQDMLTVQYGATLNTDVGAGVVTVKQALNNAGTITNAGTLNLQGSHSGHDTTGYTGDAMINTGTINGTGTTTITGALDSTTGSVSAGTLNIGDSTVATLADRTGSLTINADNLGSAINNYVTDGLVLVDGTLTKAVNGDANASTQIGDGTTTNTVTNEAAIGQNVHVASGQFTNNATGSVTGDWTIDDGAVAINNGTAAIATINNAGTLTLGTGTSTVTAVNNTADYTTAGKEGQGVTQNAGAVTTVTNSSQYALAGGSVGTFTNNSGVAVQTAGEVTGNVTNGVTPDPDAEPDPIVGSSASYTISGGKITGTITNKHEESTIAISGTAQVGTVQNDLGTATQSGGTVTTVNNNSKPTADGEYGYTQTGGTVVTFNNGYTTDTENYGAGSYSITGGTVTTLNNNYEGSIINISEASSLNPTTITTINNKSGSVTQTGGSVTDVLNGEEAWPVPDSDPPSMGTSGSYTISGGKITGTITNQFAGSTVDISGTADVANVANNVGTVSQSGGSVSTAVTNAGEYNLTGGTIAKFVQTAETGDLNISNGASLTINGTSSITDGDINLGKTVTDPVSGDSTTTVGSITFDNGSTNSAKVVTDGASTFEVKNGTTFTTKAGTDVLSDAIVKIAGTVNVNGKMDNTDPEHPVPVYGNLTLGSNDELAATAVVNVGAEGNLRLAGVTLTEGSQLNSDTSDDALITIVADQSLGSAGTSISKGILRLVNENPSDVDNVTLTWTNGTLTTGYTPAEGGSPAVQNAKMDIGQKTTFDITGGTVILNGLDSDDNLTGVNWDGTVQLNGGSLTLKNIKDVSRVDGTEAGVDYNKTGLLNALNGNLTIDESTVLLGNGDVIAEAVVLSMTEGSDVYVTDDGLDPVTAKAQVTVDSGDNWTSGKVIQTGGELTLKGVSTVDGNTGVQSKGGKLTIVDNAALNTVLNSTYDVIGADTEVILAQGNTLDIQKTSTADTVSEGDEYGVTLNDGDNWSGAIKQTTGTSANVLTLSGRNDSTTANKTYNMSNENAILNLDGSTLALNKAVDTSVDPAVTVTSGVTNGTINLNGLKNDLDEVISLSSLTFDNDLTTNQAKIVSDGSTMTVGGDTNGNALVVGGANTEVKTKLELLADSSLKANDSVTVKDNGELTAKGTMIESAITNDGVYNLSGDNTTAGTIAKSISYSDTETPTPKGTLNLTGITKSENNAEIDQNILNIIADADVDTNDSFTIGENADVTVSDTLTINADTKIINGSKTDAESGTTTNASKITAAKLVNNGAIEGLTTTVGAKNVTTYGDLEVTGAGSVSNGKIDAKIISLLGTDFDNNEDMTAHEELVVANTMNLDNADGKTVTAQTLTNTGVIKGDGDLVVVNGGSSKTPTTEGANTASITQKNITLGVNDGETPATFNNDANMSATVKLTNEENSTLNNTAVIDAVNFVNDGIIENKVVKDPEGTVVSTGTIQGGTLKNNGTINNYGSIVSKITNTTVNDPDSGELIGAVINNTGTLGEVTKNKGIINTTASGLTAKTGSTDSTGIININAGSDGTQGKIGNVEDDIQVDIIGDTLAVTADPSSKMYIKDVNQISTEDNVVTVTSKGSVLQHYIEVENGSGEDNYNVFTNVGGTVKADEMLVNGEYAMLELNGGTTGIDKLTVDNGTLSLVDDAELVGYLNPSGKSVITMNDGKLRLNAQTKNVDFTEVDFTEGSTYSIVAKSNSADGYKVTIDSDISAAKSVLVDDDSTADLGYRAINSLDASKSVTMGSNSVLSLNATDSHEGVYKDVTFTSNIVNKNDGDRYTLNINNDDSTARVTLDTSIEGAKEIDVKAGIMEVIDSTVLNKTPINVEGKGDATVAFDATDEILLDMNITGIDNETPATTTANHKVVINDKSAPEPTNGLVTVNPAARLDNVAVDVQAGEFWLQNPSSITKNSTVNVQPNATLNVINQTTQSFGSNYKFEDGAKLKVDIDMENMYSDNFAKATKEGTVVISEINSMGAEKIAHDSGRIGLQQALGIKNLSYTDEMKKWHHKVLTPIRELDGFLDTEQHVLNYYKTGDEYENFNSAIFNSSVAAQIGGYLTQLDTYNQAFGNFDMYELMSRDERNALKFANKYAASDSHLIFNPLANPNYHKAAWFRPYTTFERVKLKGGPSVSNVSWGTFAGLESGLFDMGKGWDANWGVYAGYNGSHQAYQGNSIYQNGATLGLVGMAYKNDFFIGTTINVSDNLVDAKNMYGKEDFNMLMSGAAVKTGYNWGLADNKFIIQPSFQTSYSFVKAFDYTNAANVRVHNDPLHAIQLEPQLKLIGNFKNGWQPYLHLSGVWNIMDKTKMRANDVSLPELSVKPYARYGFGLRKTFGDRASGFFQTFFTSGGRNGMGLQFGFKIQLGDSKKKHEEYQSSKKEKKYIGKV